MYGLKNKLISVRVDGDNYKLVMEHLKKDTSYNRVTFGYLVDNMMDNYLANNKIKR